MKSWTWEQLHGLPVLTVPSWQEKGAKVYFTSRKGGSSTGPYDSLNLGLHVGDDPERVICNRRRLLALFGQELEQMVSCAQIHGNRVGVVERNDAGKGAVSDHTAIKGWDGMATAEPGLVLATFYADCIPLFFFDPCQRVVAVAHSGWQGTYLRIAQKTTRLMVDKMGCKLDHIQVFIGPGIGSCCYRIQTDLADKVKDGFADFNDIIYGDKQGCFWNLKATNMQILTAAGVPKENIIECPLCTSCASEHFFSYRRDQGITGRMGAAIALAD